MRRVVYILDADKIREQALIAGPDSTFAKVIADFDEFAAKGEKPIVYYDGEMLWVGTVLEVHPAPRTRQ